MGIVTIVALFVLGAVCAANLIIAKKPEAKALIAKISPYQGWIGAISAIWGVWWLINWIMHISAIKAAPVVMITALADSLLLVGLGLLCGIGVMKMFVKAPAAVEKLDLTVTKLAPFQGMLGLAAMGLSVWTLLDIYVIKIA